MKKAWAIVALLIVCSASSFPFLSATDNPVTLSDDASLSDDATSGYVGSRSGSEALECVDVIVSLRDVPQSLSEVITQDDALQRLFTGARGMSEAIIEIDALMHGFIGQRTLTDTPTLTDILVRLRNVPKALSDALVVTEALSLSICGPNCGGVPGGSSTTTTTTTTSSSSAAPIPLSTISWNPLSFVPTWGWVVIAIVVGSTLLVLALTPTVVRVYRKKG